MMKIVFAGFVMSLLVVAKATYSAEYQATLLKGLNDKRRALAVSESISNMFVTVWDKDLEATALQKVKMCERKRASDFNFFSIYNASLDAFPKMAAQTFVNKENETGFTRFGKWDLMRVGCAHNHCDKLTGDTLAQNVYLLGCAFVFMSDPVSEASFNHMFDIGVVCSKCEEYRRKCVDKLCDVLVSSEEIRAGTSPNQSTPDLKLIVFLFFCFLLF